MYTKAFSPTGPTVTVTAATSAPSGVQVPEVGTNAGYQFRIHNGGSVIAYLGVGSTAGAAQSAALVASGIPIPAGVVEVLSFPVGSYFSAITGSSTAAVYLTPGKGL
jgi:hypothetical protein